MLIEVHVNFERVLQAILRIQHEAFGDFIIHLTCTRAAASACGTQPPAGAAAPAAVSRSFACFGQRNQGVHHWLVAIEMIRYD